MLSLVEEAVPLARYIIFSIQNGIFFVAGFGRNNAVKYAIELTYIREFT
jgi:hypothetical protein